jgi:hypothetical protein
MKEFTMLPKPRLSNHLHHKLDYHNIKLLKLSSIYGANGAGKSNFTRSLQLLKDIVEEKVPIEYLQQLEFKFHSPELSKKQTLVIEFIQDNIPLYYGVELKNNIVITEELYISGLGKLEDKLIFERKTGEDRITQITFSKEFERDEKNKILKSVLLEEFVKPNKLILKLLANRENELLKNAKLAYKWFNETLIVLKPDSKPVALAHRIDIDQEFKNFAENIMCAFNLGVISLNTGKMKLSEIIDVNDEQYKGIVAKLTEDPTKIGMLQSKKGDELILVNEDNEIIVKQLSIEHIGKNNTSHKFDLEEESDGTVRLLDFVPAFRDITKQNKVYVIDEVERSIHPLLIKELITKFSLDQTSRGQLIFTTHESNLLDQEIFRQDEIWFVEKDKSGATDIYSLSDFRVHKTKNLQKGYLNGRYGAIPFLGNLKDLNWNSNDSEK